MVRHPPNRTPLGWNQSCLLATMAIPASECGRTILVFVSGRLLTQTNIHKPTLGELLLKNKSAGSPTDTDILSNQNRSQLDSCSFGLFFFFFLIWLLFVFKTKLSKKHLSSTTVVGNALCTQVPSDKSHCLQNIPPIMKTKSWKQFLKLLKAR